MTGTEPNRYDPTEAEIASARTHLDRHADEFGDRDLVHFVLGWIESDIRRPGTGPGATPAKAIREARAMLAAYDARRAVES